MLKFIFLNIGYFLRILFITTFLYVLIIAILYWLLDYVNLPVISLVYWLLFFVFSIYGQWHVYKWYYKPAPKSTTCPCCNTVVKVTNLEKTKNSSHCVLISPFVDILQYYYVILMSFFRPRLHLHCPNCGLDEIVCPYCDKPISENDKKCPHCGKRVL